MILKIFILIMMIVILAGKPQLKPKGWPEGKPWPPPKPPKPKDGIVVTCPKKKEAIKKIQIKNPYPKKSPLPKRAAKGLFGTHLYQQ